jgi:Flp pilus assembly pilin Flp
MTGTKATCATQRFRCDFWGNEFVSNEQGQDLTEYALLLAFVVMVSTALFMNGGDSVKGIWAATNNRVTYANTVSAS